MAEIFEMIFLSIFAFGAGFLFGKSRKSMGKDEEEAVVFPEKFKTDGSKNPSLAQQMINIMNYNGENQTEEIYD